MRILLSAIGLSLITMNVWSQSILSEGTWHKIGVTQRGLYKIDAVFLSSLGINTSSLDPKTIKVCGFNGGMLPQSNAEFVYLDPPENALIDFTNNDSGMDSDEYLLFYAEGPDKIKFEKPQEAVYEKNIYSDTAYYFLSVGGKEGKRAQPADATTETGNIIDTFHEITVRESEEINLLRSGRRWFGDEFSNQQTFNRKFDYEIPGLLDSINLFTRLATQSEGKSSFNLTVNNQSVDLILFDSIPTGPGTTYTIRANEKVNNYQLPTNGVSKIGIELQYNPADVLLSRGFIDFFMLTYERELALYGNSTFFTNPEANSGTYTYHIKDGTADQVFIIDVTDPVNIRTIDFEEVENEIISFTAIEDEASQYLMWQGSDFSNPGYFGTINNQDLKSSTQIDGLIITNPLLMGPSMQLKNFHESREGLSIRVVDVNRIYNEFSSGRKDLTALRNYIRYIYDSGKKLKYVLLMGDCSYDYKYQNSDPNHIPIYESYNSFSPIYSYSSDDYLGFLDSEEGIWNENFSGDHDMEIGVGRIPANTVKEADDIVKKIIRYATSERTLGKWRNEIAYFADDGDQNIHMSHAVTLSGIVEDQGAQFRSRKIFLDNFNQIRNPLERSPDATRALEDAISDGLLVLNFIGHGNEFQWMEEETLNNGLISQLNNRHKLPLIVTATCEFGRYDEPTFNSGAENLLLLPNGGAIALITTTRPVFAHTNLLVNRAFHESLLNKVDNQFPRLGDVIRETKNNSLSGPVNRNFALLGDPFLRLNYPKYDIGFGSLETNLDTLSAFEEYSFSGAIMNSGDSISDFNGRATVSIIDIPQDRITKGQENPRFSYQERSNTLFRSEVSVENGLFNVTFVLPKNISYKLENGKILVYAWDEEHLTDASGANENIVIGGTDPNPATDVQSPEISLYINDETFQNGQTVGPNSLFIAKISDQNGINISSNGFNQDIILTINDETSIALNDFYEADLDTYQSGTVLYPLRGLEPGSYRATLKVWDTYNNSFEKSVDFKVSDKPLLNLYNVVNYPNPVQLFSHPKTTFSFEHDRQGEELEINLDIYDMTGSIKFTTKFNIDDSQSRVDNLEWRPSNTLGAELDKGIYIYRLRVTSTTDGASNEAVRRLIIIN